MYIVGTTPEANRGYSQPGREKTTDLINSADIEAKRAEEGADLKESFEIGREGEPNHPNPWPDRFDEEGSVFKELMLKFHDLCKELHIQVMRAIAVGLGIEGTWYGTFRRTLPKVVTGRLADLIFHWSVGSTASAMVETTPFDCYTTQRSSRAYSLRIRTQFVPVRTRITVSAQGYEGRPDTDVI